MRSYELNVKESYEFFRTNFLIFLLLLIWNYNFRCCHEDVFQRIPAINNFVVIRKFFCFLKKLSTLLFSFVAKTLWSTEISNKQYSFTIQIFK